MPNALGSPRNEDQALLALRLEVANERLRDAIYDLQVETEQFCHDCGKRLGADASHPKTVYSTNLAYRSKDGNVRCEDCFLINAKTAVLAVFAQRATEGRP